MKLSEWCSVDNPALGAELASLVTHGGASVVSVGTVLASWGADGVKALGCTAQVAEAAEPLAVDRWVEAEVCLAGLDPFRETLVGDARQGEDTSRLDSDSSGGHPEGPLGGGGGGCQDDKGECGLEHLVGWFSS